MLNVASFAQVAATFWHVENRCGALAPLTPDMVGAAEEQLGLALPVDLLALLGLQNGGVVADSWDACPAAANSYSRNHVPFEDLMGIGRPEAGCLTLLDTPYLVEEWGLPSPVVLLSGQGHYWIALDYRVCGPRDEPSVIWLDSDLESELPLAPDFRSFVERLTSSDGYPDD